jgi:hypothetical protein
MRRDLREPSLGPGRKHREAASVGDLAVFRCQLHEEHLVIGRVERLPLLQRLRHLIVNIRQDAVRPVSAQQIAVVFGRRDRLGRVEHRRQIVGRVAEDVAAKALQVADKRPAIMVLGEKAGHVGHLAGGLQHRLDLVERVGQAAELLDKVVARRAGHIDVGDPRDAVEPPLLVAELRGDSFEEIVCAPIRGRLFRVLDEIVERRHPAGADPAADIDEGDVDDVIGRTARRQLDIHALVVDREGRRLISDLRAGGLLELRNVIGQVFGVGGAPTRDVELDTGERLAAGLRRRLARQHQQRCRRCAAANQPTPSDPRHHDSPPLFAPLCDFALCILRSEDANVDHR